MLVAALPLYVRGERLAIPGREEVGFLAIEREHFGKATIATLSNFRALGAHPSHAKVLPPLYEPVVRRFVNGQIDIRGIERADKAWHLQVWSCRSITTLESEVMHRTPGASAQGLTAVYLRWWALVWDAASQSDFNANVNISDIPDIVEGPIEDVWPFLDWAARTGRCYGALGGKEGLGTVGLKNLHGREANDAPKESPA